MIEKKSGIYVIRNLVNGKVYVGQAIDTYLRWHKHKSYLKYQKHPNFHLQASWNKYGEENFVFEIIEEIDNPTKEIFCEREQYWCDFYDSSNRERGYNKRIIIESNLGIIFPKDVRKKMSESHIGELNHFFGKNHTNETKIKMRENHPNLKGDKSHVAKLNWTQVHEIREKYKPFEYSFNKLAKEYNVSKSNIMYIIQNKTWKEENNIEDENI